MAFTAEFMTFQKRVNSTAIPGQGTVYNIELKGRTNIFNPVIVLNYRGNPTGWNYCRIGEFGSRYYWIVSWTYDSGLWYAACAIDVLATYHDDIGDANLYVLRSASEYDGNVVDSYYPTKSDVYNTCSRIDNPFISQLHSGSSLTSSGSYLVGILNNDDNSVGATSYYLMTDSTFRNMCSYLFNLTYTGVTEISENLQKMIFDPMQYIISVMYLPFHVDSSSIGASTNLKLGYWQTPFTANRCTDSLWKTGSVTLPIPKHPQIARGRYLSLAPYSVYGLEFWPWGSIPLDGTKFVNATYLKCDYIIDFITGVGNLRVTALDELFAPLGDGEVITAVAQVGVPIQMAQSSLNLGNISTASLVTIGGTAMLDYFRTNGLSLDKFISGDSGGSSFASGDGFSGRSGKLPTQSGAEQLINNIGSAVAATATEVRVTGSAGGLAVFRLAVRINARFVYITDEDLEYIGRPLCKYRVLKNLSGFCQVADGDIALAATAEEAQAVKRYLESGIYLEGYHSGTSGSIVNVGDDSGEQSGEIIVDDGGGSGGDSGEIIVDDGGGSGGNDGEIIVEG